MNSFRLSAATLCVAALAATTATAQVVGGKWTHWKTFKGANTLDAFGISVASAGDVNNDGFADVIVGAYHAVPNSTSYAGSAYVYSGKDGTLIWQFDGAAAQDFLGCSVAGAGDVDKDGYADVIIGAFAADPPGKSSTGSAFVYSGKDKSLIWRFDGETAGDRFGDAVAGAGDVNKDGYPDVIVGAWAADPGSKASAGSAYVYSGKDKKLIWQFDGAAEIDYFGYSVAGAGDVNNDGHADVLVGAYGAGRGSTSNMGSAYVYSGKDKKLLWKFDGTDRGDELGRSVAGAGDVNNDRYADVIIGAHNADPGSKTNAGSAYVYSGKDKTLLWQFDGTAVGDHLGSSVAGAGDVNKDGYADVLVGAPSADPGGKSFAGSVYLYSGKDKTLIAQFDGDSEEAILGSSVAAAGDVNDDGYADVILGAPGVDRTGSPHAGAAEVHGFNPFLVPSRETVNVTYGGVVFYRLLFPPEHADDNYIILLSAADPGSFWAGVQVPLRIDPLLIHTVFYDIGYGVHQSGFRGKLDGDCRSLAFLGIQGGVFGSAVGLTVRLAAIAYPDGYFPTASSVAVPLKLVK